MASDFPKRRVLDSFMRSSDCEKKLECGHTIYVGRQAKQEFLKCYKCPKVEVPKKK